MSHDTTPAGNAETPAAHGGHHLSYFAIFVALCICTVLSVIFDSLPLNKRTVAVMVLAVAVAKAQFVMRYFMHLTFEGNWKFVLLLPVAILACGLPLALGIHVPELDRVVTRSARERCAVAAEGNRVNRVFMTGQALPFTSGFHVPELDGVVMRSASQRCAIRAKGEREY